MKQSYPRFWAGARRQNPSNTFRFPQRCYLAVYVSNAFLEIPFPKPDRLLEVSVLGTPEDDITRSSAALTVSGDTVITPQFISNPFPALAGNWSGLLEDKWVSGLVTVSVTSAGQFSLRALSGRNSFSRAGTFDGSGRAQIAVPANFWPYAETKNVSAGMNSTAKYPTMASLGIEDGRLKFAWGWADISSGEYDGGNSYLEKSFDAPALVAALPSKRYNAALWKGQRGAASMDTAAGFCTADLTSGGVGLFFGMARVADKAVRFSFSGNLVSGTARFSAEDWNWVPPGGALNFYSVTSSSEVIVFGRAGLHGSFVRGPLSSRFVRTGPMDPLAASLDAVTAEADYQITGYPYLAPAPGAIPRPFTQPGKLSFGVTLGSAPLGTLRLSGTRPVFLFQSGVNTGGFSLTAQRASLSLFLRIRPPSPIYRPQRKRAKVAV